MSGNGSHRLRNSEDGADLVGKVKVIRQCCFVVVGQESARHLLGMIARIIFLGVRNESVC